MILGVAPDPKPILESLPADKRRAEFLAKIVVCESRSSTPGFQTRYDPEMPGTNACVLRGILDRHRLPVYPIVVYLTETSTPIENTYSSHVGNKQVIAFNYDVIKVWELRSKMVDDVSFFGGWCAEVIFQRIR